MVNLTQRLGSDCRPRVSEVMLLPYPQYSSTTTASVFDGWAKVMAREPRLPRQLFLDEYHAHPAYIAALAQEVFGLSGSKRVKAICHGDDDLIGLRIAFVNKRSIRTAS